MAALDVSVEHNDYRLLGSLAHLSLGTGHAVVQLYGGTRPVLGGAPTTLLAECGLDDSIGALTSHQLVLVPGLDGLVVAGGVATWARCLNRNGDISFDCDVSNLLGSAPIRMSNTVLAAGGYARIVSAVFG